MKRLLAAASILVLPSLASAQGAPPAAPAVASPARDVYDMSCSLFHHNADGSWNATRAMTLRPAAGPIPLKTSFRFKRGTLFAGFDLASALDKSCPH